MYRVLWLEVAEAQYLGLDEPTRQTFEEVLTLLAVEPTQPAGAVYNEASDQWSVPLAGTGLLFYAVVEDHATVIILRILGGLG
jgi:hypothetical protein